jgi:hypothetical protein
MLETDEILATSRRILVPELEAKKISECIISRLRGLNSGPACDD